MNQIIGAVLGAISETVGVNVPDESTQHGGACSHTFLSLYITGFAQT